MAQVAKLYLYSKQSHSTAPSIFSRLYLIGGAPDEKLLVATCLSSQQADRRRWYAQEISEQPGRCLVGFAVRWRSRGPNPQGAVLDSRYLVATRARYDAYGDNKVIAAPLGSMPELFYMTANGRNPETIRVSAPSRMIAKIGERSKPPSCGMMRWNGRITGSVIE